MRKYSHIFLSGLNIPSPGWPKLLCRSLDVGGVYVEFELSAQEKAADPPLLLYAAIIFTTEP